MQVTIVAIASLLLAIPSCEGLRRVSQAHRADASAASDSVIRVELKYSLLMAKEGLGEAFFSEQVTTGFTSNKSTTTTIDSRITTKVESAIYSVALSAEATFGYEFVNHFSLVETETRTELKTFTAPINESWYLYQAASTTWLADGRRLYFGGVLVSSNQPKPARVTQELDLDNVVLVESWRKNEQQFLCYEGHPTYYRLPGYGWGKDSVTFFAFQNREGGTVPINVYRKGEKYYYVYDGHPTLTPAHMQYHGWGLYESGVFYAYRPGDGPRDAVRVHVWRKNDMAFYVTADWVHWDRLPGWGWTYELLAFSVPKFGF